MFRGWCRYHRRTSGSYWMLVGDLHNGKQWVVTYVLLVDAVRETCDIAAYHSLVHVYARTRGIYMCMYIHMQCLLTSNQYAYAYNGVAFTINAQF